MQIGMIGLGRMGANMARRLLRAGHQCIGYDQDPARVSALAGEGLRGTGSLEDFVASLEQRRIIWIMLPAGELTAAVIRQLAKLLQPADIVVDGGNSNFRDDLVSQAVLGKCGVHFMDCGTSGGIRGGEIGYCLMIGGDPEVARYLDPVFRSLVPGSADGTARPAEQGYLYCGPTGAGHFVKMVHNGIEYGVMQSFAEGFDLLDRAEQFGYELPLPKVAELWRHGSVISSRLLDLAATALSNSPDLAQFEGSVADSGEGRWTVQAAVEAAVPCPVLTEALYARFRSRVIHTFGEKLLSAMRLGFGGHTEQRTAEHSTTEYRMIESKPDGNHSRSSQPV